MQCAKTANKVLCTKIATFPLYFRVFPLCNIYKGGDRHQSSVTKVLRYISSPLS